MARPEITGKNFEKHIQNQLVNIGYSEVESKKFLESQNHHPYNEEKIFTTQFVLGKNIYKGKQVVDFIISRKNNIPLVIQAKWQQASGSVNEKFPYLVLNLKEEQNPYQALIIIDGGGYGEGALDWLKQQVDNKLIGVFSFSEFVAWSNTELS